jgi:uncharacterized protein YhbP (UPF0306 family)
LANNSKLKETVLKYLKEHNTMTIATVKGENPWAAAIFYANDGFTLYFLSDPESRHSKDIAENPLVAVTVNEDYHDWRQIKGIQMEGKAEVVTAEDETARAVATYVAKYSFTAAYLKVMSSPFPRIVGYLDNLLSRLPFVPGLPTIPSLSFYKITPTKIRFIDNEKSFAHHEEFIP